MQFHLRLFDDTAFRELYGIAEDAALTAYDTVGRRIDFAKFAAAVGGGQDFDKTVAADTGAVDVRLKTPDEAELRTALGIAPDAPLRFFDVNGVEIDFAQFANAMQSQRASINKTVENATGATKLQLAEKTLELPTNTEIAADLAIPKTMLERIGRALGDEGTKDTRPVLLSFYFSECGSCIAEVPALNRFARSTQDIRTLAVTFDDERTSQEFKTRHVFEWPVLSDAQDIIDVLGVKSYPTFVLIGADGAVKARSMAAYDSIDGFDEQALRAWIDAALAVPDVRAAR